MKTSAQQRSTFALCVPLALSFSAAAHAQSYGFSFEFGSRGNGNGQFQSPSSIAFAPVTDRLLVSDGDRDDVQVFSSAGAYRFGFGQSGTGDGDFASPAGVYVSSDEHVYVADYYNTRVEIFDNSGNYLGQLGTPAMFSNPCDIAIDPVGGDIYVSDAFGARVLRFDAHGNPLGSFGSPGTGPGEFQYVCGLAVDRDGHVFAADEINDNVQVFDVEGRYLSMFGSQGSGNGQLDSPADLAIDPFGGGPMVADFNNHRVEIFDRHGAYRAQFGTEGTGPGQLEGPIGLAIGSELADVYVADRSNARIEAFTPQASACGATAVDLSMAPLVAQMSQPILFSARAAIGLPFGGTMTFVVDGTVNACSAPMNGASALCTHTLGFGTHSIVARYSGDGINPPGCSVPADIQIVGDNQGSPTGLGCRPIPDVPLQGQPVRFLCTISQGNPVPTMLMPAGNMPDGYVTFSYGGIDAAESPISFGTASYANALAGGPYAITATYSGDGSHASSSTVINVDVSTPADDIFYGGFEIPPD